jgi:NDP-sugar pyrophosphorylase family protein
MLPIADRPMITYAMDHLIQAGVKRIIINTHHAPHTYTKAFPDRSWRGIPITFVHEPTLLDTGGGLKNIEPLLAPQDLDIWLYNGDILTTLPLHPLLQSHLSDPTRLITLALRTHGTPLNVRFNPHTSQIIDLRHQLNNQQGIPTLYAGIALVRRSFLSHIPQGKIQSLIDILIRLITQNQPVHGCIIDQGTWSDLGTPEDYQRAQPPSAPTPNDKTATNTATPE